MDKIKKKKGSIPLSRDRRPRATLKMRKLKEICERPRSQKLKNFKHISADNIKCDDLCNLLQMLKNFNYRKRLQGYSVGKFSLLISHSATLWVYVI